MTAQIVQPDWAVLPEGHLDPATSVRAFELPEDLGGDADPVPVPDPAWKVGYRDGHEEGFRDGHEAGRSEGFELGRAEAVAASQQAIQAISAELDSLHSDQLAQVHAVEAATVSLALEIAEMVIGHHVAAADDPGAAALVRALGSVRPNGQVVARLHPDDLELLATQPPGVRLELVADPSVGRGGCMLDAGASHVDATLTGALDRVRAVLDPEKGEALR